MYACEKSAKVIVSMHFAMRVGLIVMVVLGVASCDVETVLRDAIIKLFYQTEPQPQPPDTVAVRAVAETDPVVDGSDAADDVAMWVDPRDVDKGWVIGTNKRRGVEIYDLRGRRHWQLDAGRVNNVDIRTMTIAGQEKIIVGATNRTRITIEVWSLDVDTGRLMDIAAEPIAAGVGDPYGFCWYRSREDDALYAFVTAKEGGAVQLRLAETGAGALRGEPVRTIPTASQPEGCVADDVNGVVFIGEEDVGIWRVGAEPEDAVAERVLVATTRPAEEAEMPSADGPHRLTADVEGLAIYAPPGEDAGAGYLIASSQGNWTYVVYDRAPPHRYRGTFRIDDGGAIDGTGDTDGLDVVSTSLGPSYPEGLLVVQDGYNVDRGDQPENQNFKYVSWADVRAALAL